MVPQSTPANAVLVKCLACKKTQWQGLNTFSPFITGCRRCGHHYGQYVQPYESK